MSIDVPSSLSRLRWATPLVGVCLVLGLSRMAMAAPPNLGGENGSAGPEEQACAGRAIGDACTLPNRQLGTCGQGTCNRLDYSQGSPPKAIETSCVVCQPADASGGGSGGGSAAHEDHPTLGSGGAPPDDGSPSDAGHSSSGATEKEPPQSSSRCRVSDELAPNGSLLGLAALSLIAVLRRRSRA